MAKRKRAILYARSATEGPGVDHQLETCRACARAHGYTVAAEYSEVASGLAPTLPEQANAIARAESDGAALICVDPMRLTRDADRLARIIADCERCGITVHFVERQRP